MKRIKQLGYYVLTVFLLTACQSYKKVPYLQDAEVVLYSTQDAQLYDAKIMPKDLLTIVVSCTSPELAAPFNLTVATQNNMALNYVTTQPVLQQYLVDNDGNINSCRRIDQEGDRTNDRGKTETLYYGNSYCNSTYGKL